MTEPVDWQARALAAEAELVDLRAAVDALAKRVRAIGKPAKEKPRDTLYTVSTSTLAEVQAEIARLDGLAPWPDHHWEDLMTALARVRAIGLRASPVTYYGSECAAVRTMLTTYPPSRIARAISHAARDDFWGRTALNFNIVKREIGGWLAAADNNRQAPKAKVDDTRTQIERAITALENAKPKPLMCIADLRRDLSTATTADLPALLARARKECEKRSITLQEEQR